MEYIKYLLIIPILYLAALLLVNIIFYRVSNRIMENRWASLKWCFKFSVDITFTILSWCIFNPIVSFFVTKDWNLCFKWMRYLWQTPDAYTNGMGFEGLGKGGDRGFYNEWSAYYNKKPSYLKRVYITWRWLTRNCGQGFSTNVTGLDRTKILIDHVYSLDSGKRTKILAYHKNADGTKGKLVGYESRDYGFFFGKGKMRMGYKLDQSEQYYPAMLVSRYLPFKNPNE